MFYDKGVTASEMVRERTMWTLKLCDDLRDTKENIKWHQMMFQKKLWNKRGPKRNVNFQGEEKEGKISDEIETVAGWLTDWLALGGCTTIMSFYKDDIVCFAVIYKQIEIHTNKLFIGWVKVSPTRERKNAILCRVLENCLKLKILCMRRCTVKLKNFRFFSANGRSSHLSFIYLQSFYQNKRRKLEDSKSEVNF